MQNHKLGWDIFLSFFIKVKFHLLFHIYLHFKVYCFYLATLLNYIFCIAKRTVLKPSFHPRLEAVCQTSMSFWEFCFWSIWQASHSLCFRCRPMHPIIIALQLTLPCFTAFTLPYVEGIWDEVIKIALEEMWCIWNTICISGYMSTCTHSFVPELNSVLYRFNQYSLHSSSHMLQVLPVWHVTCHSFSCEQQKNPSLYYRL